MSRSARVAVPTLLLLLAPALAVAQSPGSPAIPLTPGLTLVRAVNDARGDYETVIQVVNVGDSSVDLAHAADVPGVGPIASTRPVLREDLQEAREYRNFFTANDTGTYPGTSAVGPSVAVLTDLKDAGEAQFSCYVRRGRSYEKASGVLQLVGPETVSVLVNGMPTQLEVLHVRADLDKAEGELWVLDHAVQPITLRYELKARLPKEYRDRLPARVVEQMQAERAPDVVQVVRIEFPAEEGQEPLEEALESTGRAEVHGIYFDFGSDELKPESDMVLERIAGLLERNPDWSLAIEGHTDNIGGDAYNQDLSERRAAAVQRALVERYGIAAKRLSTVGFGATRPKASNDTLEGRARNRRVELVRQ